MNEVIVTDNQRLKNKITELISHVRQLVIEQYHTNPPTKVSSICASAEHPTNVYPTLQETEPNSVEVAEIISDIPMISTQTRDMTITLYRIYLKTTKVTNDLFPSIKHLHSDNKNSCNSLYIRIP
ncbi:hypothetical protein CR513_08968, partial [Mucuna pruriens]